MYRVIDMVWRVIDWPFKLVAVLLINDLSLYAIGVCRADLPARAELFGIYP